MSELRTDGIKIVPSHAKNAIKVTLKDGSPGNCFTVGFSPYSDDLFDDEVVEVEEVEYSGGSIPPGYMDGSLIEFAIRVVNNHTNYVVEE